MRIIVNILAFLLTLNALIHMSSLEFNLGFLYYALFGGILFLLMVFGKNYRFNPYMILLVLAGLVSILFNNIPSFFQAEQRFVVFLLVLGLIGPLVQNSVLGKFRVRLFSIVNISVLVIVIISFFGIVAGLSIMEGRGGYTGLFTHSMVLGPMAAVAMLTAIHKAYNSNKKKNRIFFLVLAAVACITCIAAGSRTALLAGIAGGLFYYYKINQGNIAKFTGSVLVILAMGILTFPLWEVYTERITGKMEYSEEQGDLLVTRAWLWEARVEEFTSSPFIGIGFASVDDRLFGSRFDPDEGRIEPGSSWLALLSMTGLLGFIPLFLLIILYFRYLYNEKEEPVQTALLGGMLSLFIVHMMAEGYVFSAGSGLFFYFWLVMGNIEAYKTIER
jgi:O-antigen ligase